MAKKKAKGKRGFPSMSAENKTKVLKNLRKTAAKKGEIRNPTGKNGYLFTNGMKALMHKKCSAEPTIAKIVEEELGLDPKKYTVGEAMILRTTQDALLGKSKHLEIALERTEGKVVQRVEQDFTGKMDVSTLTLQMLGGSTPDDDG